MAGPHHALSYLTQAYITLQSQPFTMPHSPEELHKQQMMLPPPVPSQSEQTTPTSLASTNPGDYQTTQRHSLWTQDAEGRLNPPSTGTGMQNFRVVEAPYDYSQYPGSVETHQTVNAPGWGPSVNSTGPSSQPSVRVELPPASGRASMPPPSRPQGSLPSTFSEPSVPPGGPPTISSSSGSERGRGNRSNTRPLQPATTPVASQQTLRLNAIRENYTSYLTKVVPEPNVAMGIERTYAMILRELEASLRLYRNGLADGAPQHGVFSGLLDPAKSSLLALAIHCNGYEREALADEDLRNIRVLVALIIQHVGKWGTTWTQKEFLEQSRH